LPKLLADMQAFVASLPNLPHESVPVGQVGSGQRRGAALGHAAQFDFAVKDHVDVGTALGGLDFETATKISGARFTLLRGGIARLHRALAQFMLDTHTLEHGYTELYAPYMVNAESMFGTGQLPKFEGRSVLQLAARRRQQVLSDSNRRSAGHQHRARYGPGSCRACR
jgi:seryl-tRNA synthetase